MKVTGVNQATSAVKMWETLPVVGIARDWSAGWRLLLPVALLDDFVGDPGWRGVACSSEGQASWHGTEARRHAAQSGGGRGTKEGSPKRRREGDQGADLFGRTAAPRARQESVHLHSGRAESCSPSGSGLGGHVRWCPTGWGWCPLEGRRLTGERGARHQRRSPARVRRGTGEGGLPCHAMSRHRSPLPEILAFSGAVLASLSLFGCL